MTDSPPTEVLVIVGFGAATAAEGEQAKVKVARAVKIAWLHTL
jgi:hypothetical protein